MTNPVKKKLIEVSLPLEKINAEAAREKSIRHGHPSTLHLYWARRPLAAARAVLFGQLVDDPSARPEEFPTEEEQDIERRRLHALIEELVVWENSNNESLLAQAREEIRKSNNGEIPAVLDPFAGGGAIPLEAQRLGLEAHASDLNPLAVLLNKALIEIPPKFADMPPVFPGAAETRSEWSRAEGLAEDVRLYGEWMRDEAEKKIGHLYPKVKAPGGTEHTVIAWIWARTVRNPNPANPIEVPLVRSWWLSKKKGKEAWIDAKVVDGKVHYEVRHNANGPTGDKDGTIKHGRGCHAVGDNTAFTYDYVRQQGCAGEMGSHLIAIVAEDKRGRLYVSPTEEQIETAKVDRPAEPFNAPIADNPRWFSPPAYGLSEFDDLFTNRQLVLLTTLTELVEEAQSKILNDAGESALASKASAGEGFDPQSYAESVAIYLALSVSRMADYSSNLCSWHNTGEKMRNVFGRQAIPMVWDYTEVNPFSSSTGNFAGQVAWTSKALKNVPANPAGYASQMDASSRSFEGYVISTDPPYYDNIGYSDLSDFFYVWLRRSLADIAPDLVATILTPKASELVANPYRHGGKAGAELFFIDGFNSVFTRMRAEAHPTMPLTVYYAYKQQDVRDTGTSSTGWHTLLDGLMGAGWEITATWPMRTETSSRLIASGTNALASSIVLACRPRPDDAPMTTRRAFTAALKTELPDALRALLQGTIAPVDLAQAAIGPGMAVYSRYSRVRDADGSDMGVREALMLINSVLSEVLEEQESDFDPETRFATRWFRTYVWEQESSGIADQLARSSDTSLGALERGGILRTGGGKARLLPPEELAENWDAMADADVSVWEATVRLAGIMSVGGLDAAAETLVQIERRKVNLDSIKELGFLLFHESEKKGETATARLFNALVSSWQDLSAQARQIAAADPVLEQGEFDFGK